ncbi:immunity to superinfection [Pseudomonas phage PspYZU05]|uniref:Superinfection immunity protein n=1 Tax=Pseudomonas phage PspYZU05 TaxID=1983556 RepID=A0A2U7NBR5_9CAUD|nr:immunity to superinfection [Pseudomonas phage PspYZU05]ASD52029.1 hypothetical protein PspYZU05_77 [Pseudomonas phage PspYZU05]
MTLALFVSGVVCFLLILVYMLPAIVAGIVRHNNFAAITVLNVLLGWSLLGWVVALVWAFTNNRQPIQGKM